MSIKKLKKLTSVFCMVLCSLGFSHLPKKHSYIARWDLLWEQKEFPVPLEFRKGTATLQDIRDWSLVWWTQNGIVNSKQPELEFINLDADPKKEALAMIAQAQNPSWFVFKKTARGYRFIGLLEGSHFERWYYPKTKQAWLVCSWHRGRGEVEFWLEHIRNNKLQRIGKGLIWKEGRQSKRTNFPNKVSEEELRRIFHL